jgi:adenylosuccinate synthase
LPAQARRYLDRIQSLVETQITYVSVGTRRDQIIGVEGALPASPVGVV